jgi:twitching motility protein PilT
MDIRDLLTYAVEHNASDLHLSAGLVPMVRLDGDLFPVDGASVLEETDLVTMLKDILPPERFSQLSECFEMDLSLAMPKLARFRVNIFRILFGLGAAFRIIPMEMLTLKELGMPEVLTDLCTLHNGLVLLTGPTGTGKSTTLAAMIHYINSNKRSHILTIEDPIEFVHQSDQCLIQQREVHQHTEDFKYALRSALREDPDIILVGEMRDLETIRLALTAAETGHLVLATLHTSSAAETINRVIDVFPGDERALVRSILSDTLRAVVSQILVKKKGGGRIAAQEIMICNPAIRNLIREDKIPQIYSVIQTGKTLGMQTLEQHLKKLLLDGVVE